MYDLLIRNARLVTMAGRGVIQDGCLAAQKGMVAYAGPCRDFPGGGAAKTVDARGMVLVPGLIDCHAHLMEYATEGIHNAVGASQRMAATANLLVALKSGITTVGEHHLGHPAMSTTTAEYRSYRQGLPVNVPIATGMCVLGTDPLAGTAASMPGKVFNPDAIGEGLFDALAVESEYAGENIFLSATVANLPPELAPLAGQVTLRPAQVRAAVSAFHDTGKRIGAHIEGNEAAELFIDSGGDAIHHGHGLSLSVAKHMAGRGMDLVATMHGGTSRKPTTPTEVADFIEAGVRVSIASDSYLYRHPEALWVDAPGNVPLGPDSLLLFCQPVFQELARRGHDVPDILSLITLNPAKLLEMDGEVGSLEPGKRADATLLTGIPGLECVRQADVKLVVKDGGIVINRM